jgi:DNA-binding GntR family transcriptional regulator
LSPSGRTRPTPPVKRSMLPKQVQQILLDRLLQGRYAPGERLVETRIAKELGVSQGTVREALRALEALKFIETAPFSGARVRDALSEEELTEVHPVRAALEDLAARLAVPKLAGETSQLRKRVEGMRRAAVQGDVRSFVRQNTEFHRAIVAAAGNRVLLDTWEGLGVEARILITTMTTKPDLNQAAERHQTILDAIERGDAREASRLLTDHQHLYQELPHRLTITAGSNGSRGAA